MLRTAREDAQHQKDEAGFHIDTYVCRRQKYHTDGGCRGMRWRDGVRRRLAVTLLIETLHAIDRSRTFLPCG